jgi:hypothetical protein
MTEYIDADALLADIRRKKERTDEVVRDAIRNDDSAGKIDAYRAIKAALDTERERRQERQES